MTLRRSARLHTGAALSCVRTCTAAPPAVGLDAPPGAAGHDGTGRDLGGCSAEERKMRSRELALREAGVVGPIAGVDEAGRGPLMGPVVAAAVVIPLHVHIEGIADSKVLTEERREELFKTICSHPEVNHATAVIDHKTIDRINILQATMLGMTQCVENLSETPTHVLIDGNRVPEKLACVGECIVKGDAKCYAIAAASIVAKVTRDRLCAEYDEKWPQYGFGRHKGYGTKAHVLAIHRHGPCEIHRRSFEPIKSIVGWARDESDGSGSTTRQKSSSLTKFEEAVEPCRHEPGSSEGAQRQRKKTKAAIARDPPIKEKGGSRGGREIVVPLKSAVPKRKRATRKRKRKQS